MTNETVKKVKQVVELPTDKVKANINPEYEVTRRQEQECHVYAIWEYSKGRGANPGHKINQRQVGYSKEQYMELSGGRKGNKKTMSSDAYMLATYGEDCEKINEPSNKVKATK